ncbi:uncharacterized protein LOC126986775 [Eriocheir sinensis]|uniref:uncharacterized protein LOC126986775 n=1 Tax=Eriocheir sinensis TaxID=95602 RepID=UPI0021C65FDB|nr:uncharacterized protein LOC126986775 [Eriocheir sinensis]
MARLVAAWAVAWAGVCLTAPAELTKIHGSLLNVCTTMGPSLTYEPVSYKLAAASEVLCAALCLEKGAQRYTTSGASCTLYGEALLAPSAAHTFLSFPSPDALEDVATGKPASGSSVHRQVFLSMIIH